MQKFSLRDNLVAYIISMRWYGSFIAGMSGFVGIVFSGANPSTITQITILGILFIGWGVNQVVNDYLGLEEDQHNAPKRPMVSGRLNIKFALSLSAVLFVVGLVITYFLNKEAISFYVIIFGLNIIYERAKRVPLLGNITFGLLIAPCVYYAAMCASNARFLPIVLDRKLATLAILIWLINFVLCFFSDFKDYEGDKKANIKTLVVLLGIERAKYLGAFLILIPFLCLYFVVKMGVITKYPPDAYFILMRITAFLCFLFAGVRFLKYPQGQATYYSLKWVFVATIAFITMLIGLAAPLLSMMLFVIDPFLIGLIFYLYGDYPV